MYAADKNLLAVNRGEAEDRPAVLGDSRVAELFRGMDFDRVDDQADSGGIFGRAYASMYPQEVAGMVLIDPSQESFDDWTKTHQEAQRAALDEEIAKAPPAVRDESAEVSASYAQARAAKVPAAFSRKVRVRPWNS